MISDRLGSLRKAAVEAQVSRPSKAKSLAAFSGWRRKSSSKKAQAARATFGLWAAQ